MKKYFAGGYDAVVNIKVTSYNIQHGVGSDGQLSLERLAEVIGDAGGEIVGIQEVDRFYSTRSHFQNQAKELADLLEFYYVFGANIDLDSDEGQDESRQYGTAILSKYPIIDSKNVFLSSFGNEQRGLLQGVINVRGIHVNVYNTHLGLDVSERLEQMKEIMDITFYADGPKIIVGDFNAEPDSEEIQLLLKKGNVIDTFAEFEEVKTFPAIDPTRRIDYIFTSPPIEYYRLSVFTESDGSRFS